MKTKILPPLSIADTQRFLASVQRSTPDECWLWSGTRNNKGYGLFYYQRKTYYAHRVAVFVASGSQPTNLGSLHKCDNPPCCNPNHLFLGDVPANTRDMINKGRDRALKGSEHYAAKLNEATVLQIRSQYAQGGVSLSQLARQYGVSMTGIANVISRRSWKSI